MDRNKLKVLRDIEYFILPTCDRCKFGMFGIPSRSAFGSCTKHWYNHLKHKDNPHELSIHKSGTCAEWVRKKDEHVGYWEEFV